MTTMSSFSLPFTSTLIFFHFQLFFWVFDLSIGEALIMFIMRFLEIFGCIFFFFELVCGFSTKDESIE